MFQHSHFEVLSEEIDDSSRNDIKKALKKLREIQALKEKKDLSSCELEKLSKECYWESILNPIPCQSNDKTISSKPISQKQKEKLKQNKKKHERLCRKTEIERKEAIEVEKRQKEWEKQALERQEEKERQAKKRERQEAYEAFLRQKEQERLKQERFTEREKEKQKEKENQKEKEKRTKDKEIKEKKDFTDLELENEWHTCLCRNKDNIDKTFRILSLKYHPDKNATNITWAQEKQKQLGLIKDFHHSIRKD